MIEYRQGNILDEHADALVNTVNCVGVMGRGIALQFKRAFPDNFKAYAAACRKGEVQPGRVFVFECQRLTPPRFIINFPTKRHWRECSRLEDIEAGLEDLVRQVTFHEIESLAVPPLGCGLGGLEWNRVRPLLERALGNLPGVRVILYEPWAAPPAESRQRVRQPVEMTPARAALIWLVDRYLRGVMDPFVTLLEVHKLLYFLQEAGEPLKLRFTKAHYGPYAENLRHLLQTLEGQYLSGYGPDSGDAPATPLDLLPEASAKASRLLDKRPDTRARVERVGRLVEGFETPFGLELLATVHWVAAREPRLEDDELVRRVHQWNPRKEAFTDQQVVLARETLQRQGRLPKRGSPATGEPAAPAYSAPRKKSVPRA